MLLLLLWLVAGGLVTGGLGRLLVPGPTPIGLVRTGLAGLAGSLLGGLAARYVLGLYSRYALVAGFILGVIFAAIIVAVIRRRRSARR